MLKEGKTIDVPIYDFVTHSRTGNTIKVGGVGVIIFEGIMTFCYRELLKVLHALMINVIDFNQI